MTPAQIFDWSLAVAALAGALLLCIIAVNVAFSFVIELVEDTCEWFNRS